MVRNLANQKPLYKTSSYSKNELIINCLTKKLNIPVIDCDTSNIRPLYYHRINEYFKNGFFIFEDHLNVKNYAVNDLSIVTDGSDNLNEEYKIYLVNKKDFKKILHREFRTKNSNWAINHLDSISPTASAKNIKYMNRITEFLIVFLFALIFCPSLFVLTNNCIYIIQNALKLMLLKYGASDVENNATFQISDNVPIYTILVPLYNEVSKAQFIINSIYKLNYPKDKLDVKLIIEEDDLLTLKAIKIINLPPYIEIIKVPYSLPRTKPKALNYAIPYALGEFVVIYDAEDRPDPNQLLKALEVFNTMPEHYACVQAKLNFYNAKESLLTRFFSIEYSLWFEYLLKGLSILDLPLTLGGTSNHFKIDKLKEVGYWDAYNVTEDADLGIRLYLHGYKVHLIDSTTFEEAPTNLFVWLSQRTRWIKGFIQTLCIFIKTKKDHRKFGIINTCTVYIFVGLSTYSFFCMPWLLVVFIFKVNDYIYYLWLANSVFSLFYMYIVICYIFIKRGYKIHTLSLMDWVTFILWPLYFILHTVASHVAICEIMVAPFKWNKTPHGTDMIDSN